MYKDKQLYWENIYSDSEKFLSEDIEKLENIVKKENYKEFDEIVKENLINCVYFNAW